METTRPSWNEMICCAVLNGGQGFDNRVLGIRLLACLVFQ